MLERWFPELWLQAPDIMYLTMIYSDRYWGQSSPYQSLTTENLQYLTLQNAIADLTHFAETVNLPFDPQGTSKASKAVGTQLENP